MNAFDTDDLELPNDPAWTGDDDVFDDDSVDEGLRGGPVYDSAKSLVQRGIPFATRELPGLQQLLAYLRGRWGGKKYGIWVVREIRGGGSPSLHSWSMAVDWFYGTDRKAADEVLDWAVQHADVLGIQGIHDYVNGQIWRCTKGWYAAQRTTPDFYKPTSTWLHIERNWQHTQLATPIAELIGERALTSEPTARPTSTASTPAAPGGPAGLPTIKLYHDAGSGFSSTGTEVVAVQDFLLFTKFASFTRSDGEYGPKTASSVLAAQTRFKEMGLYTDALDGIWGKHTAAAAEEYLKRSGR